MITMHAHPRQTHERTNSMAIVRRFVLWTHRALIKFLPPHNFASLGCSLVVKSPMSIKWQPYTVCWMPNTTYHTSQQLLHVQMTSDAAQLFTFLGIIVSFPRLCVAALNSRPRSFRRTMHCVTFDSGEVNDSTYSVRSSAWHHLQTRHHDALSFSNAVTNAVTMKTNNPVSTTLWCLELSIHVHSCILASSNFK